MKALIIDDDNIILEFMKSKLSKEGFEVLTATDATQAFDLLPQNPAIIITDVLMPGLTGLDFLRILKNRLLSETPIIVISVLEDSDTIYKALEIGANDYLTKPIDYEELLTKVKKFTTLAE